MQCSVLPGDSDVDPAVDVPCVSDPDAASPDWADEDVPAASRC
jgi:hypothetical protein